MIWLPGPRSKNLEDRRFEWSSPEELMLAYRDAAERGDLQQAPSDFDLPPWLVPEDPTQETALNRAAFRRAFGIDR